MTEVCIRAADERDLPAIVRLHRQAFPTAFMTALGPLFLRQYYRLLLRFPPHILLLAEEAGGSLGFVAGFLEPAAFYAQMKRRRRSFALAVLLGALANPLLIPRILLRTKQVQASGAGGEKPERDDCELSSIAVAPSARGRGLGKTLTRRFAEEAARRGARRITLTTDADHNEAVNGFYRSMGFERAGSFNQTASRRMNRYRLNLTGNP